MRRAALLLVAIVLAGCGGGRADESTSTGGVRELDNVLALRSDFEADRGKTRLLILLSPT
ncbi:MAG TPA: hypothetical protein VIA10_06390 [Gaiellaceae bacterium]